MKGNFQMSNCECGCQEEAPQTPVKLKVPEDFTSHKFVRVSYNNGLHSFAVTDAVTGIVKTLRVNDLDLKDGPDAEQLLNNYFFGEKPLEG